MACSKCAEARKRLKTAVTAGDASGAANAVVDGLYIITQKVKGMVSHTVSTQAPAAPAPQPPAPAPTPNP